MSTASLVSSLSDSLRQVPPVAVPPLLDCVLASTGASPSSLFASLLTSFPLLTEGDQRDGQKWDAAGCNRIGSFVRALCHLLKQLGTNHDALESYIWKIFIPLMKRVHSFDREMLNQIAESFFDVVGDTNAWRIVEVTLVPFLLRSIGMSIGMVCNSQLDVFEWGSFTGQSRSFMNCPVIENTEMVSSSGSVLVPTSCHILAQILDAVLESEKLGPGSDKMFKNGKLFTEKIWKCCKTLFSLGNVERRDAYCVLSLCLSFSPHEEEYDHADTSNHAREFDIRDDKELWDEIKRGLVDKESLVRKQSLHILKMALGISEGNQTQCDLSGTESREKHSDTRVMTKREIWAEKEARSLGIERVSNSIDINLNTQQSWEAFILLYEMLEEYGTHLVEAAWTHQIFSLLNFCSSHDKCGSCSSEGINQHLPVSGEFSNWLSILWDRGFHHDNPQVRCLILESFVGIEWNNFGSCVKALPESFVLGPLMQGLNDPIHHEDFGTKGVYSSKAIEGASRFLHQYTCHLGNRQKQIAFLTELASITKRQSFGRAGLMALSECITSVARRIRIDNDIEAEILKKTFPHKLQVKQSTVCSPLSDMTDLLDALRYVVESCKQHFNPNYRRQVCDKILEAASSVVCSFSAPLQILIHFIGSFPREFTVYGGSLRSKFHAWLLGCRKEQCSNNCCSYELKLLTSLIEFPGKFIRFQNSVGVSFTFDDEDLAAWESEAKRWAMVLFLVAEEECYLEPLLTFIQNHCTIFNQESIDEGVPVKYIIFILSLLLELQEMRERGFKFGNSFGVKSEHGSLVDALNPLEASGINGKFLCIFTRVLKNLVAYANVSCSIFWSSFTMKDAQLPGSVKGKLGGPSQRRLSTSLTTVVLQAIMSVKAVASISLWCAEMRCDVSLDFSFNFLWDFLWRTISSSISDSEMGAELHLAAYEALTPALRTLVSAFSQLASDLVWEKDKSMTQKPEGKPQLDSLVFTFLQNVNDLLAIKYLARTRRAVLMNWKWHCLESLLSIHFIAQKNGIQVKGNKFFFSDAAVRLIFSELVESLENAGEDSVLPILRSVRLVLELFASGRSGSVVSSRVHMDTQMMWQLVRSSWILHASCNKRRVAAISALLSSVLHPSVFSDESMHISESAFGPLKWFVEMVLEEGTKSPRTIRLVALHLTGLWLSCPRILKCYIKELKLLSLYGSVAFDEDFEAELSENRDAKNEVSVLAKIPEPELTEVFINTELYARVSVAILISKLANLAERVGSANENEDCIAALEAGKLFLLELLDSAVNEKDLAKELYKKYSAIHRRKIRVWQMICVLTPFVREDIVEQVTHSLHIALYRNNLPAVRQYLETFAINVYLKFPSLVRKQLVPILRDYGARPQALSSYVFISANVILHASESVQSMHLDDLLPPIIPLLTSHHHSLRGFTQLLLYKVLCKFFPPISFGALESTTLEKKSFEDLKEYLAKNSDCARLRASMEGYLDAYNPYLSATPTGIFVNRVEELEFECVPTSLMDHVLNFLNDVREDLRCSMARDVVTIKNEGLRIDEQHDSQEASSLPNGSNSQPAEYASMDFQKKFTLSKHEKQDDGLSSFMGLNETLKQLLETEKEDQLVDQLLQSRLVTLDRIRSSRQNIILVASLIDRIPNLAGLARTCEVFKASGLAISDATILRDKQFQLISVTAEKWVPIMEVPVKSLKGFLEKKKREGFSILGLEQTANSVPLDQYTFPKKTVLILGREKEGIPVEIIHILDACIEIPQLGVVRSLNVHVSGAIALWEYTRQQRS
ncbi:uncharacterized protein LOC116203654 isoform X2 [Punica granatum]|uniref:tRNA (guanosine(18)-2'-O)-methyltransferase TARBP1 n=1 Tax=Punica granatum TaxID=22663 RepID=A0A6P8D2N1_PUNGR|nr:uncharacterized protein LOC116203654 isoform X2 [Punica granatum]